jgi:pyridoxamine 5'-phosphate oxidase family protein
MFSEKEVQYLKSQHLARISTVSPEDLQPDVSPVGFDFDGEYFYVGGINLSKTRKYKNVLKNKKVALVIDDLETVNPWAPRAIRIYGTADIVSRQGGYMDRAHPSSSSSPPSYIRIRPLKKWSWGVNGPMFMEEGKVNIKSAKAE